MVVNCPSDLTVRLRLNRQVLLDGCFMAHAGLHDTLNAQTDVLLGDPEQFGRRPWRQRNGIAFERT